MKKIPVTVNGDHTHIIGHLTLDDTVGVQQVLDSTVSWAYRRDKDEIIMMTLVPKPKVALPKCPRCDAVVVGAEYEMGRPTKFFHADGVVHEDLTVDLKE